MFDYVIRGATICDGSGQAGYTGDLAVEGDRIAAVGSSLGKGQEEIDADGLVLAPGIIDTHTHYDAQVTWDPHLSPSHSRRT